MNCSISILKSRIGSGHYLMELVLDEFYVSVRATHLYQKIIIWYNQAVADEAPASGRGGVRRSLTSDGC